MGCWAAPFTTEQAEKLKAEMSRLIPPNIAIDLMYELVGDDDLSDQIDNASKRNDGDVRYLIMSKLQEWFGTNGDDLDVMDAWGFTKNFEIGALRVIRNMLTKWNEEGVYPSIEPNAISVKVRKYNHAYTFAFTIDNSIDPTGEDVTAEMFRAAVVKRVHDLDAANEWDQAMCDKPFNTIEI